MSPAAPAVTFFLQGSAGKLFVLYVQPSQVTTTRRDVILVPPFAEEMNKSRHMLNRQAQALADMGIGVLMPDLYGTGDSEGDFAEARWSIWKHDIAAACAWLVEQGSRQISLLGLRLGALLALDFARSTQTPLERIILWQPVLNGTGMMTQFLRQRLAASMLAGAEEKDSTENLRRILHSGQSIEVGGYDLAPELQQVIDTLRIDALVESDSPPIHWLELVSQEGRTLTPASQKIVQGWHAQGIGVNVIPVPGPAFWSSAEIVLAPSLLQETARIFQEAI